MQWSTPRSPSPIPFQSILFRTLPFPEGLVRNDSCTTFPHLVGVFPPLPTELASCKWQLLTLPLAGLGLHLESNEYQMAIRWWLGLDTSARSMCPFCPDTALDPLGHHAVTCRHEGKVVIRHNRRKDEVFNLFRSAHQSVSVERGHGLTRDLAHTRPADILIADWDRGNLWR